MDKLVLYIVGTTQDDIDDAEEATDEDGHEYEHSLAFGDERCGICHRKPSKYEDLWIDAEYSDAHSLVYMEYEDERVYCTKCIEFILVEEE